MLTLMVPGVGVCAGRAPVPVSYEDLWRYTNQVFATHGISVIRADSTLGVIEGSRKDGAMKEWFTCPAARGAIESVGYSVTVLLDSIGPESTSLRVNAFGISSWYQNRYFLVFKKSPLRGEVRCESTGKLEQILFSEIVGGT